MVTKPPAAGAGPRQPHKHECGFDFKHEVCLCVDCGATKPIELPWSESESASLVPQEAAPRCEDCQWHGCGTGCGCKCHVATAPDWAMRVAREIADRTTDRGWSLDWAAALIRQAGREQERELLAELESLRGFLPNVAQILDGWHNDGTAWSKWDESIRKQLGEFQKELECLMTQK